eukprot:c1237_g1_i2.p1 GENE.c1237_g1_i2~~c1237_g1_i2.p1  ORF type:complete len:208 (+),score=64.88 c1237_g1_i2:656-1279(+)
MAMKEETNVIPVDLSKPPAGNCANPLDIGATVGCEGAKAAEKVVVEPEGDEDVTKEEVLRERMQQRDTPMIEMSKENMDLPEDMSRKEFFQYVADQAMRKGRLLGREEGMSQGYLAAMTEAMKQKNETLVELAHRSTASLAQMTDLVQHEQPLPDPRGSVFPDEDMSNRDQQLALDSIDQLGAVESIGNSLNGISQVVESAANQFLG